MTDRPATPTRTNVPVPISHRAAGMSARRGASQTAAKKPAMPA